MAFRGAVKEIMKMKKFTIKKQQGDKWLVSHNEHPRFTCLFEDKKFIYRRTLTGLCDPAGDPEEIELVQRMEKWLSRYHKEKING
ncbi:hypothetical protein [Flavobacterium sp. HBTb2-11-1]|uniref:hypothetical protein n=1 Tax=Flavobacterium sp. HBTb2-11-1 TaxID=2692212 RepID=UPI00136FB158|nr:hypothetical protein [Flavobacterium sp. HBTb2-11-1]MXO04406.1 hypothetical protein [Flavobacterium sp. HBTb2-11-1]